MSTEASVPEPRPGVPFDTFGVRLRLARTFADDISIEEAADRCGLKPATWSTWERGVHNPPHRAAVAAVIASALGVDADWLLNGGQLNPEPPHTGAPKPVTLSDVGTPKHHGKRAPRRNSVYNSEPLGNVAA